MDNLFMITVLARAFLKNAPEALSIVNPSNNTITTALIIGGIVAAALLLLLALVIADSRRKMRESNKTIAYYKNLLQTFMEAQKGLAFLKDQNLNYLMINSVFEQRFNKARAEIIGKSDLILMESGFAQKLRGSDLEVLEKNASIEYETEYSPLIYETVKFPVKMRDGGYGVGAYVTDKTIERGQERLREQIHERNRILLDVLSLGFTNKQEKIDYALNSALSLTKSKYGVIFNYSEKTQELTLNTWTSGVIERCGVAYNQMGCRHVDAGIWAEAIRRRKPVTVNEMNQTNPLYKGYPEGHIEIKKLICVPILWDEQIVALVCMANKETDYDDSDIDNLEILMSGLWQTVLRSEMQEQLVYERNKYLQTLVSIGDGVMVVDKYGNIEMINGVAQSITGWTDAGARGRPYTDVFVLSNENPELPIEDPIEAALKTKKTQELVNNAVLTSRNGTMSCLEDSAAPIFGASGEYDGVVVVFRDVTDKKAQRQRIEHLSFHDMLTGLYNRRFFEEELIRIDTKRNIPISIVMGDINGLKLTNDVFGHSSGDSLLKTIADVFRKNCRADDIIARWGGDEFVMLLPKTQKADAERLAARIKEDFAGRKVRAIRGSISMGIETKENDNESIQYIMDRAEEKMYSAKTLESKATRDDEIDSVLDMLHRNIKNEEKHSKNVGELCEKTGMAMGLPEIELRNLKELGYYHDIGKVVLDPAIFEIDHKLTEEEFEELMKHPSVGYRILSASDKTVGLAEAVLSHHERWDGIGYPRGRKGEEIPMLARILAVAEVYDRLITGIRDTRPSGVKDALEYLKNEAGKMLDPQIVSIFVRMIETEE